ncbi:polymeric immunoglobulin receptor-like [Halichoeres trimaculatus]|uniref:polymeric immunoglobulin receptor-like n=1 Tax=Halichoeres trimaculatus TaxID=147232 RepID=UPI003D9E1A9B
MARQISFLIILTGITGIDSITTVSKVSVKAGGSISIPCLYEAQYTRNVKYLCKGYYWKSCSYAIKTTQGNMKKYSISDDKEKRIFNVSIGDLMDSDAYYWCAVEISNWGDTGTYFQLSVTSGTPSLYVDHQFKTSTGQSITIKCSHSYSGQNKWCRLGGSCVTKSSGSIDGSSVIISESENFFTVTMSGLKPENSGWYFCVRGDVQMPVHLTVNTGDNTKTTTVSNEDPSTVYQPIIISLSVLILLVMVTLLIWFLFKRHVNRRVPSIAETDEDEITYTVVSHVRKKSSEVQATDEDVVYSNVSQQKQSL